MSNLFFLPQAVRVDGSGVPYAGAKANFYLTGTTTPTNTYQDSALATPHANPVVANAAGQFPAIYLDPAITYRCIITDENDVQLDDVDPVSAPAGAADFSITDAGGYFTATTIEGALQEIGANYAVLGDDETIAGNWLVSGSLNFQDNVLQRPMVRDFALLTQDVASSSGTATINVENGNSVEITLTEDTTIVLSNPTAADDCCQIIVKITQDSTTRTVTWPASVDWNGGVAPTMSTGSGAVDIYVLRTWDGGTTWYGEYGQAYS